MSVPTNLIPTLITGLQEYTGSSTLGYMPYILEGRTYKVQFANIAAVGAVPSSRVIAAGTGLAGGGDLTTNRVISIAAGGVGFDQLALSGVTQGTYGSGSAIPILTVDAKGRVTSATTAPLDVTGFVPTSRTITAGDGLTGGGSLANNVTLAANFSAATPSALGTASAGTAITVSRGDHVHPAVNLSDTSQTQGALPLGRGGTGDALSPVAGAVVYSTGSKFALTNPGLVGQVLVSGGTDEPQWQTIEGAGTVTSVNASGGATGLSFTGGPITVSGTLTLGGTLAVASGGTGATTAAAARTNLGAAASGANSDITSLSGITGSISTVDSITFDTAAAVTVGPGQLAWNVDDGTINIGMGYDGVTQQVGLEQYFRIKASAAITNGQCVMFTGAVGASGVLTGAPATSVPNPQYIMGVATMDIANNGFGYITSFGVVRGITTTGASVGETWVDGDVLYYNPAYVGGLTKVEPIAPLPKAVVASVINAGSGGSGSLFVRVQAEPNLQGLTDVYAPSPISNGQILIGDGPQSRWEAATLTAGTNVSITNAAGAITINSTDQFSGTVTSVAASGGTTGLTFTGSPITTSGTLTLGGTLAVANGGTGATTAATALTNLGAYPASNPAGYTSNVGTVTSVSGTGTVSGLSLSGTVTSSGSLTLGGTLAVLPSNFASQAANTVLAAPSGAAGVPTFRAIVAADIPTLNQNTTGTASNVTGTVAIANGGTGATTAAAARTNLGATTVGGNFFTVTNPSAITFARVNADNTVSLLDAATFRTAIGAGTGAGSVTSVSGTGTVSGLTLSGTVTTSGSLTLGGTLSVTPSNFSSQTANTFLAAPNGAAGVPTFRNIVAADVPTLNQNTTGTASNVTGIVAVANGGTGASTAGTARTNLGAAASGANTDITSIALTTGTISTSPVNGTDIVNKVYADSIASGINFHQSVRLATAAALPANTYNNGTSGVGATLTGNANGALTVDGVAAVVSNRILVKNEAAGANNGVYTVTQVGSAGTPYILTRATDFDSAGTGVDQIDAGDFFLVTAGSTQSNTSWVQQTPLPITVGTTALVFTQFAAPVLYSAGTGLTLAGTVFSITNTGVTASTYGSASSVPVIAVNAQGQATSVTNTSIAIAASQITSGTVTVAQGGTGATTLTANGVLLGNGTSAVSATAVGATGQVLVGNTGGAPTWASLSGVGVTSFSAGTTGFTPSTATTGAITLAGTLNVANGGTGTATAFTAGSVVFAGASGVYTQKNSNFFWDNTNDRLGIGTTSPSATLDVNGNIVLPNSGIVNFKDAGGVNRNVLQFISGEVRLGGAGAGLSTQTFYTAAAERMRITANGDVLINTTASLYGFASNPSLELNGAAGAVLGLKVGGVAGSYIQHSGDLTIANTTANNMRLFTNNTERMRITSAGDVGIGTSGPASTLNVRTASGAAPVNTSGSNAVRLTTTTTAAVGVGPSILFEGQTGNTTASYGFAAIQGLKSSATLNDYSGALAFFTQNNGGSTALTERMRIDGTGNVGIGTTSPATNLDVNGNLIVRTTSGFNTSFTNPLGSGGVTMVSTTDPTAADQRLFALGFGSVTYSSQVRIEAVASEAWTASNRGAYLRFNTTATGTTGQTERMRITDAGNVGIGATPSAWSGVTALQMASGGAIAGNNQYLEIDTNAYYNAGYKYIGTGLAAKYSQQAGVHVWFNAASGTAGATTSFTERMRITDTGNVGIGTSSPAQKLSVAGTIESTSGGVIVPDQLAYDYATSNLPTTRPALSLDFVDVGALDPRVTFTRASTATFVGSNGLLQSAAVNAPRFEYDPTTRAPKGLLIEEQRVNRTLQSENFTVSPWAAAVSGTSTRVNTDTSLGFMRGTITATSALGGIRQSYSGLASGQVYALSFYVQSASTSLVVLLENGTATFGTPHSVTLNPSNGTAGTPTGYTSVTSTPFSSGYIYTLITAPAGGTLVANFEWRLSTSGDSMLYGRPQLEAGAFATSYIPTVASTVTRSADVATMTGTNFSSWYNQSEGTFVAGFDMAGGSAAFSNNRAVLVARESATSGHNIYNGSGQVTGWTVVSGVDQAFLTTGALAADTTTNMAYAYKTNDFAASRNGGTVATDTSGTLPAPTVLGIGSNSANSLFLSGHIRSIVYYPTRLANATLQALTA